MQKENNDKQNLNRELPQDQSQNTCNN
jgi:hypothetical protein